MYNAYFWDWPERKIIAFYCRSSLKDKRLIEKQQSRLIKYAKKQGIDNYKFYIDDGYNGDTLERSDLKKLIKNVKDKKVYAVITSHDDRLVKRSIDLWKTIIQIFDNNNVSFTSLQTPFLMDLLRKME